MFEKIKEFMKAKCWVCGKRIDTKQCREGYGGGIVEAICWKCVDKRIKENPGDNK